MAAPNDEVVDLVAIRSRRWFSPATFLKVGDTHDIVDDARSKTI